MRRIADVAAGQVDLELRRYRIRLAGHLDFVTHHVEHAAALEAGRLLLVEEHHGHHDVDLGIPPDPKEIDMDRPVGDRVELQVAGQDPLAAAADLNVEQRGKEAAAADLAPQVLGVQGDQNRVLLGAIDDARNAPGAARGAGGPLSGPLPRLRRKFVDVAHLLSPRQSVERRKLFPPPLPTGPASRGAGAG